MILPKRDLFREVSIARYVQPQATIDAMQQELNEVEQILGRALGYPLYADDQKSFPGATAADGVCTGDHTPISLAMETAARITELKKFQDDVQSLSFM